MKRPAALDEEVALASTPRGAVQLLNEALATELVCVLRYKRHYFMAAGLASESVKAEFLQHAAEEQGHADKLAQRILQLGGEPDLSPDGLSERSHSRYAEGGSLKDMIKEDLENEKIAIDSYKTMIKAFHEDPTTRRLLEEILAVEEEHAEELASFLKE